MTADPKATKLLLDVGRGQEGAGPALMERVYGELRALASHYLKRERADHTLQPTALVNEVYLRLIDTTCVDGNDRQRFLSVASRAMRRILVDHARARQMAKRGGGEWRQVTLADAANERSSVDLLVLNEALDRLSAKDPRAARIVELRYFGGLSIDETAAILGVSDRTIDNDWFAAKAWLARELQKADD